MNFLRPLLAMLSTAVALLSTIPLRAQAAVPEPEPPTASTPVTIDVDLSHTLGTYRPIDNWFGYDEANYTTAPGGRKLLKELHDLSSVPVYIRFHHLLTSGNGTPELKWSSTGVYSEDAQGRPVYNFTILDGLFDALKAAGVRPYVEFGFMPKDLAGTLPNRPEPYQVHFPGNTISGSVNNPPRDYKKWADLIRAVTAHLVQRYGRDAVLQWYFEVWNEPDIEYWHGSPEDYDRLYDYTVAAVRAALPGARVGGPASTGPGSAKAAAFLRQFLEHIQSGKSAVNGGPIPLDFISFHVKGKPIIENGHVTMGIAHELTDADRGFAMIQSFPRFRQLPVVLSEADPEGCAACSSRQNPANNYRNGTMYPTYTAAAYKALLDLASAHHIDLISMLSWSFEFEDKDYFEGFRSLSTNGIDKPILNFFRMAGLLSGDRVLTTSTAATPLADLVRSGAPGSNDIDALATSSVSGATGGSAILLWNYREADTPAPNATITLHIHNLPPGARRVLVQHYRIDATHSNAYTLWQEMGSPQRPTAQQYAALENRSGLELLTSPAWLDPSGGMLTLHVTLPPNSLSLVRLRW